VIASWVTPQLVFNGFVSGLVTGLLAMGMVLVYRSTRVVNLAAGNLGLVGASLLAVLVLNFDFPFWVAVGLSLAVGTLFGAVVELTVIRRLFTSPRVIVLVATVGIAQLAQGISRAFPKIVAGTHTYPVAVSTVWTDVFGLRVTGTQLSIVVVVPLVAIGLAWMLHRTTFGKAVEASADNAPLSRLSGVNPKIVSTFVWTCAGLLSTLSIILLSAQSGSVGGLESLGPLTLSRALVVFVLADMRSFPRAVVFGAVLGVGESVLRFNFLQEPGLIDFLGFVLVLIVVYVQSRSSAEESVFAFVPKVRRPPERVKEIWWIRRMPWIFGVAVVLLAALLPIIVTRPSRQLLYASIACFAICALSVTVITGWAGQLSLSQMTFAGLGALIAAALVRGVDTDVLMIDVQAPAVPFMLAIPIAAVIVAGIAAVIGLGALRVRGLRLAVTTFVFAVAAQQYLYRRPFLSDGNPTSVSFRRGTLFGVELGSQRAYFYVCAVALVVVLAVIARLRRSGIGRSTIAVRDNPDAAAACSVSPARTKLTAFAMAGGIAAIGGALLAGLLQNIPFKERYFLVGDSLQLVGMAVIGGIGSLTGPIVGALWVIGLPAFFPDNGLVPLFTSSIGLLLVVMYFPGGFAQIGYAARNMLYDWAARRLPPVDATAPTQRTAPARSTSRPPAGVAPRAHATVLDADGVSVRFGGNRALTDASISVEQDEIVGLIGANGAGKTTFMNAIGGYLPSTGRVELLGTDISALSVPARARLGLGRTFQAALLFPELTVRETIQVALEARGRTPFVATALGLPTARAVEHARRADADELIDFFGLGRYANEFIADLSTGTRRIVELSALLGLDAKVLCLDEPTAGLAQRETEAFAPLLVSIRRELGASMIVIEHDMTLIMSISDRVYCLEAGRVIAHGEPADVRADPRVIASYLGTDERAIARSNAAGVDVQPV
jgi:ABC-type branched-subunit amino acid transport system ATPase component/ABC-type branched-subunit amino acid transport system permease subunit